MMRNGYAVGMYGQKLAEEYLTEKKWTIIERNYRTKSGEIDIIAHDGEYLVFVEVKYRRSLAFGEPPEAVTSTKRGALRAVAEEYLCGKSAKNENPPPAPACRFDVVAIYDPPGGQRAFDHIANAF